MNLRVDLTPRGPYRDVVVLIDVLRTCTIAPLLFDHGLRALYLSPSIRRALRQAADEDVLLIGERGGLPPEGFNYGNSPAELWGVDVRGRCAVLVSDNGPRVLGQLGGARHVLLGSLYNADAAFERAAALAREEVALVCAGFREAEDLDDALCAGYLCAQLQRHLGAPQLGGAALLSMNLLKAFPAPLAALWQSRAGHYLRELGLSEDIAVASLLSQTAEVPELRAAPGAEGLYRFEAGDAVPAPEAVAEAPSGAAQV